MKIVIDIDDEMVCNDIKCKALEPTSATDEIIINALYNGMPYEERPKGEWIEESSEIGALGIKYTWIRCNRCGWDNSLVIPKSFCPNCGADMRGGRE